MLITPVHQQEQTFPCDEGPNASQGEMATLGHQMRNFAIVCSGGERAQYIVTAVCGLVSALIFCRVVQKIKSYHRSE